MRGVAAADQEVQVALRHGKRRGTERAGIAVTAAETVDEAVTKRAGDAGAGCRGTVPEGGARRRPVPVAGSLEVREHLAGRRRIGGVGRREGATVEAADEVLDAARAPDREDPADIHRIAVDRQREQVRAFPDGARRPGRTEFALARPAVVVR